MKMLTPGMRTWIDRGACLVLASGALLMVQPYWKAGFQSGFWITLVGIILVNISMRLRADPA